MKENSKEDDYMKDVFICWGVKNLSDEAKEDIKRYIKFIKEKYPEDNLDN